MSVFNNWVLYVTVEPWIMCAHALAISGVKEVYYGSANDKFGGNGSVFSLHKQTDYWYKSVGGIMAEEAVELLQKFYMCGNQRLPQEKRHRKLKF